MAPAARRALVIQAAIAFAAFCALIWLGTWQLERKAWKEALIDTLEQRLAAAPGDLPPPDRWAGLDRARVEFGRVSFAAEFIADREALVFNGGSTLRADASGPGYWVFAPARLSDGKVVVVNRGFVPEGRQDPSTRAAGEVSGNLAIVGVLRWPEARSWYTPGDDPVHNLWFVRDHAAIALAKGWGQVAPFYVEQEAPIPPGGLPRAGPLRVNLPNNHLQYAITWYGLAAVLAGIFAIFAVGQRRRAAKIA